MLMRIRELVRLSVLLCAVLFPGCASVPDENDEESPWDALPWRESPPEQFQDPDAREDGT